MKLKRTLINILLFIFITIMANASVNYSEINDFKISALELKIKDLNIEYKKNREILIDDLKKGNFNILYLNIINDGIFFNESNEKELKLLINDLRLNNLKITFVLDFFEWKNFDENSIAKNKNNIKNKSKILSISDPNLQSLCIEKIEKLINNFDISEICLKNFRYVNNEFSYDDYFKLRFYGLSNINKMDEEDWKREQVSKFVSDIYSKIYSINDKIKLSSFTDDLYNPYISKNYDEEGITYYKYYQDTLKWVFNDYIDSLILSYDINKYNEKINYQNIINNNINYLGKNKTKSIIKLDDDNLKDKIDEILKSNDGILIDYHFYKNNKIKLLKKYRYPIDKFKNNENHSKVSGYIFDENKNPIRDALVVIKTKEENVNFGQDILYETFSSNDGYFSFNKLPENVYFIDFFYEGLEKITKEIKTKKGELLELKIEFKNYLKIKDSLYFHIYNFEEEIVNKKLINILGRTIPDNKIFINDHEIKVYKTGAFIYDKYELNEGENKIDFKVISPENKEYKRTYKKIYIKEEKEKIKRPDYKRLEPINSKTLMSGDILNIKFEGISNLKINVSIDKYNFNLNEIKTDEGNYYIYNWKIPIDFNIKKAKINFEVLKYTENGFYKNIYNELDIFLEVWNANYPRVGIVVSEKALLSNVGSSARLGGPYLAEIEKDTLMQIIEKTDGKYKVKLSDSNIGWILEKDVELLEINTAIPHNSFTYLSVYETAKKLYVSIPYNEKIVYSIRPSSSEKALYINLYNTSNSATWISNKINTKYFNRIEINQIENDFVQLKVYLNTNQIWGYKSGYKNGSIKLILNKEPILNDSKLKLKGLTIGIEAGHGKDNNGAIGLMGTKEKNVNSQFSKYLKEELEKEGAKVIIIRKEDTYPEFSERIEIIEKENPDIVFSIHSNAASTSRGYDRVSGVSTYYKYNHLNTFAKMVQEELCSGGMKDFGVIANFNYYLLRDTQSLNLLVELGFLSNPSDEEKLNDREFLVFQSKKIVNAIIKYFEGINLF